MTTDERAKTNDSAADSVTPPPGPGPGPGPSPGYPTDDEVRALAAAERTVHAGAIATGLLAALAGVARPERGGVDWIASGGIGPVHVAELEAIARETVAALERIVARAGLVGGDAVRERARAGAVLAAYTFGEAIAADHVPGAKRETAKLLEARDAWRAYAKALEPFAFEDEKDFDTVADLRALASAAARLRSMGEDIDEGRVQS